MRYLLGCVVHLSLGRVDLLDALCIILTVAVLRRLVLPQEELHSRQQDPWTLMQCSTGCTQESNANSDVDLKGIS